MQLLVNGSVQPDAVCSIPHPVSKDPLRLVHPKLQHGLLHRHSSQVVSCRSGTHFFQWLEARLEELQTQVPM